jgi:capsular polysaccharide biosynthesis protein
VTVDNPTPASDAPETSLMEAFWLYRWSSLFIVVMVAVAAAGLTAFVFNTSSATARFAVTDPRGSVYLRQGVSTDTSFISYTVQRAAFAQSADVLRRAAKIIKDEGGRAYSLAHLRSVVKTKSNPDGAIVSVTASAESMRAAARIANAVVTAYRELTKKEIKKQRDEIQTAIEQEREQIGQEQDQATVDGNLYRALGEGLTDLQTKENDLRISPADDGITFTDDADPNQPESTGLVRNTVVGLAVGALFAAVVAFLRATSRTSSARRRPKETPVGGIAPVPLQAPASGPGPVPGRPARRGLFGRRRAQREAASTIDLAAILDRSIGRVDEHEPTEYQPPNRRLTSSLDQGTHEAPEVLSQPPDSRPRFGVSGPAQNADDELRHGAAPGPGHPSVRHADTPAADLPSVDERPAQPNGSVGHLGSSARDVGEPPTLVLSTPPGSLTARGKRKTQERRQAGREDQGKPAPSSDRAAAPTARDPESDRPQASEDHDPAQPSMQEILTRVFGSPQADAREAEAPTETTKREAPTQDR